MKNSKSFTTITILSLLFFVFTVQTSIADTYYVDRNHASASDANPGTLNSPWATIQHAAETAEAGDTVYIRNGTYNEHVYIDNAGNAVNGYIVFSAYQDETPVIDGTGVTESQNGIIVDKAYIKLIGLEIRNWNDNGIWLENASNIEISDCVVHDVLFGIGASNGTHDFELNRVEMHHFFGYGFDASPGGGADCYNGIFNDCVAHTGSDPEQNVDGFALGHGNQHDFTFNRCETYGVFDGFDISARNTMLNGCLAYDCANGCYKLWQNNIKLTNCTGYNAQGSIVELDWDGQSGAVSLINCTFFNSETYTIWVENSADQLNMTNCILAGGDNIGLAFEQRNAGNYQGDYNLFQNDNPARAVAVGYEDEFSLNQVQSGAWTTYSGQDAHSRVCNTAAEIFVNPGAFNLHLLQTSPAVDNGTNTGAPSVDYDGNPRPAGQGVDIGAYEYQTVGVPGEGSGVPQASVLFQNYPNPFNAATKISYRIPEAAHVSLEIYNSMGQKVAMLADAQKQAGAYDVHWNGRNAHREQAGSGIYLIVLKAGDFVDTKKMVLMQ